MRIVIKVGTSTLAHPSGRLNIRRTRALCRVLSDIKNMGNDVILVTSGAIGMGMGKLSLKERPADIATKQAVAAIEPGVCHVIAGTEDGSDAGKGGVAVDQQIQQRANRSCRGSFDVAHANMELIALALFAHVVHPHTKILTHFSQGGGIKKAAFVESRPVVFNLSFKG